MPYLEELRLNNNHFYGPIPDELSAATSLEVLWLGNNQLTGRVPASLGALPNLISIWLTNNYLEGELPASLTNLALYSFWYDATHLCEPCDQAFLNWLGTIHDVKRTWPCKNELVSNEAWLGKADSYFRFHGYCWPPEAWLRVETNGHILGYVPTDFDGRFSFEAFDIDPDEYTGYFKAVVYFDHWINPDRQDKPRGCSSANADEPVADTSFFIVRPDAPLLASHGDPNILTVPQGIGYEHWLYLPLVKRTHPLSIVLGEVSTSNGLVLMEGGDFDTEWIAAGSPPETARRTGSGQALPSSDNNQVGDYYLQINAEDSAILGGNPSSQIIIEVEYLDQGTDLFLIQYDAWSGGPFEDGRFKDTQVITKTGSGEWRTAVFDINDTYFANRDHDGDFRIFDAGDGYEIIRKVTVKLLED